MKHAMFAFLITLGSFCVSGQSTPDSYLLGKWNVADTLSGKIANLEFLGRSCGNMGYNGKIQEIAYRLHQQDSLQVLSLMSPKTVIDLVVIKTGPDTITLYYLVEYMLLQAAKNLPAGTATVRWGTNSGIRLTRQKD